MTQKKKKLLRLNVKKNFLKITRLNEENPGLNINLIKLPALEGFCTLKTVLDQTAVVSGELTPSEATWMK